MTSSCHPKSTQREYHRALSMRTRAGLLLVAVAAAIAGPVSGATTLAPAETKPAEFAYLFAEAKREQEMADQAKQAAMLALASLPPACDHQEGRIEPDAALEFHVPGAQILSSQSIVTMRTASFQDDHYRVSILGDGAGFGSVALQHVEDGKSFRRANRAGHLGTLLIQCTNLLEECGAVEYNITICEDRASRPSDIFA